MKLGLLVVVAVAVLLPSFSESRIVSKCELRDKLRAMLKLPKKQEEGTLATVICEMDRSSHLNTSFITVFSIPATPKPTVITAHSTAGVKQAATVKPTSTDSTTQLNSTTTTTTRPATTKSTFSLVNTTLNSNSTGGDKKPKQEAYTSSQEENGKKDKENNMKPLSYGLHGLFQLSDRQYCDSGNHLTKNECQTSCTAFTDDDITNDIACVIKTGYWRLIEKEASRSCRLTLNFFKECK